MHNEMNSIRAVPWIGSKVTWIWPSLPASTPWPSSHSLSTSQEQAMDTTLYLLKKIVIEKVPCRSSNFWWNARITRWDCKYADIIWFEVWDELWAVDCKKIQRRLRWCIWGGWGAAALRGHGQAIQNCSGSVFSMAKIADHCDHHALSCLNWAGC